MTDELPAYALQPIPGRLPWKRLTAFLLVPMLLGMAAYFMLN